MTTRRNLTLAAAAATAGLIVASAAGKLSTTGETSTGIPQATQYSGKTATTATGGIGCVFEVDGNSETVHSCFDIKDGTPKTIEDYQAAEDQGLGSGGGCCSDSAEDQARILRGRYHIKNLPQIMIEMNGLDQRPAPTVPDFSGNGGGGGGGGGNYAPDYRTPPTDADLATVYPPRHLISEERTRVEAEKSLQECIDGHKAGTRNDGCGGGGADATGPVQQQQLEEHGLTPSGFA